MNQILRSCHLKIMETTALYPNRLEDKNDVESKYKLAEFGNETTQFYSNGIIFATGYTRIVYGDHGPYLEFERKHIQAKLTGRFGNVDFSFIPESPQYFYHWLALAKSPLKIYFQLKTVRFLKNAPKRDDGKRSAFNRAEGYADYKIGCFYVSPFEFKVDEIG